MRGVTPRSSEPPLPPHAYRPNVRGRQVPPNGLPRSLAPQNARVSELSGREAPETTVLVAIGSSKVREALVAMLGAIDGFQVVCEVDSADAALEAARRQRPRLALIEPELSDCGGWWVIQQIRAEQLACVVVALGKRADGTLAEMVGAQSYVQMGASPRDLLSTLEAAMAFRTPPLSTADADDHLTATSDGLLDQPAAIDR